MPHYFLGIDIGGTNTRMVLQSGRRTLRFKKILTPNSPSRVVAALKKEIPAFAGGRTIRAAGLAVAGVLDPAKTRLLKVYNMPAFDGWRVKNAFGFLRVPVRAENDVRCFLMAEADHGAAQGRRNAVGVAIGTGIGGAVMIDGKILSGSHGSAGEVGFLIMDVARRKYFEDLAALQAYRSLGDRSVVIGLGIASLVNAFDPEIVVLGGGAVRSKYFKLPVIRKAAQSAILNPLAKKTPIVAGRLGDAAQAIGATLLFFGD